MAKRTPQESGVPNKPGILQTLVLKLMPQTFALMQRSQSSIEIKQNAKGNVEFVIKCYADSVEEAQANGIQSFVEVKDKIKGLTGEASE